MCWHNVDTYLSYYMFVLFLSICCNLLMQLDASRQCFAMGRRHFSPKIAPYPWRSAPPPSNTWCLGPCQFIYGCVTVSDSLNGCWRPICLVFGTAMLCDALVISAMYKSAYVLTYLPNSPPQTASWLVQLLLHGSRTLTTKRANDPTTDHAILCVAMQPNNNSFIALTRMVGDSKGTRTIKIIMCRRSPQIDVKEEHHVGPS